MKDLPPPTEQPYVFPEQAVDDGEDYLVRYADGHLTVDVLGMPLEDLLMEIGRQSGAQIKLEGLGDRTVTDAFTNLSLDAALRRLVSGKNFSLTYAEQRDPKGKVVGTQLKELNVYGSTGSVSTYRPPPSGSTASGSTAGGHDARPPAPGRTLGGSNQRKPTMPSPEVNKLEEAQPQKPQLAAEPEEEEPAEFANPVTAAILGRRGEPPEGPLPLEEPLPADEEFSPFPDELQMPEEEFQPFDEELPPFQEELPPPDEDFEGEPAAEDSWYQEYDGGEVLEDPGGAYEGAGYE